MLHRKDPTKLLHKQRPSIMEFQVKAIELMMRTRGHKDDSALGKGKDTFAFINQLLKLSLADRGFFKS